MKQTALALVALSLLLSPSLSYAKQKADRKPAGVVRGLSFNTVTKKVEAGGTVKIKWNTELRANGMTSGSAYFKLTDDGETVASVLYPGRHARVQTAKLRVNSDVDSGRYSLQICSRQDRKSSEWIDCQEITSVKVVEPKD